MSMITRLDTPCPQCGGTLVQSSRSGWNDGPPEPISTSCAGIAHTCTECGHYHSHGCGYRIDHEQEWLENYKRQVEAQRLAGQ